MHGDLHLGGGHAAPRRPLRCVSGESDEVDPRLGKHAISRLDEYRPRVEFAADPGQDMTVVHFVRLNGRLHTES